MALGADASVTQDGNYLYLVMEYLPGGDVMVSASESSHI